MPTEQKPKMLSIASETYGPTEVLCKPQTVMELKCRQAPVPAHTHTCIYAKNAAQSGKTTRANILLYGMLYSCTLYNMMTEL